MHINIFHNSYSAETYPMSTNCWLANVLYLASEYYLAMKSKSIQVQATLGKDLENIIVHEKNPVTQDHNLFKPFYMKHPDRQINRNEI